MLQCALLLKMCWAAGQFQLGRWRDMMSGKEEFIEIFREKITRPGADALLDYLENKSDFFTAPASARYHGAYAAGCVTTA